MRNGPLMGPHWEDIYSGGGASDPVIIESKFTCTVCGAQFDGPQEDRPCGHGVKPQGYHTAEIKRGVLGEISKIQEEVDELSDAHKQQVKILMLCEVADLVGAIEHYLEKHCPGFTIKDAQEMARLTRAHKENSQ